ncbi:WhiB family transcriptional regulator [Nocardioides daphniae]|uniref:4Fe-4S Wbl-type domain-containing protein n=1 Tax=Nocardioides daphniae TaxID=402297 RepID=A0A4P7UDQ3_9ACTN|nr:WhiB family transcriptional regulator [Nocardioides daphniae]QCC78412.1 hypothetical protein E2C04_16630 [Nocardioides daphniae]GGD12651.1 hypothetical protein GCM10007231_09580 [Nocardioides daphniae]
MNDDWRDHALCRRFPDLPWIAEPQDRSEGAQQALEAVCRACPVADACADFASHHRVTSAFYAGRDRTPEVEAKESHANGAA